MEMPLIVAIVLIATSIVGFVLRPKHGARKHYHEYKRQSRSYFR